MALSTVLHMGHTMALPRGLPALHCTLRGIGVCMTMAGREAHIPKTQTLRERCGL